MYSQKTFHFFLLFLALIFTSEVAAQSAILLGSPNYLEACGPTRQVQITVNDTTSSILSNAVCSLINLPAYLHLLSSSAGTATVNGSTITGLTLNPGLNTFIITVAADCNVNVNSVIFNFVITANGGFSQAISTPSYGMKYPVLYLTNLSPPISFDASGNACRMVKITNTGLGAADGFNLTDLHGNNMTVTSISYNNNGIPTNICAPCTTAATYPNTLFHNDTVALQVCFHQTTCSGPYNDILKVSLNCTVGGVACNNLQDTRVYSVGNLPFSGGVLSRQWVSQQYSGMLPYGGAYNINGSGCMQDSQVQVIMFTNTGTGVITSANMHLITGGLTVIASVQTSPNGVTYTPATLFNSSFQAGSCAGMNNTFIDLGALQPTETVYVKYKFLNCQAACTIGSNQIAGSRFYYDYTPACGGNVHSINHYVNNGFQPDYTGNVMGLFGIFPPLYPTPAAVIKCDTFQRKILLQADWNMTSYAPGYNPLGTGTFVMDIHLDRFTYCGAPFDTSRFTWTINGYNLHPNLLSFIGAGNTIHAEFLHPFNGSYNAMFAQLAAAPITEITYPLCADCACGQGQDSISFYYKPDMACAYTIPYFCLSSPILIQGCPQVCPQDHITMLNGKTFRLNTGSADSTDDGCLDMPATTLKEDSIRRYMYIYKDIIRSKMTGVVIVVGGAGTFGNVFAVQNINYGAHFVHIPNTDSLIVHHLNGTTSIFAGNINPTTALGADSAIFTYNLGSLSGSPFQAGDTITFMTSYRNNYGIWTANNTSPLGCPSPYPYSLSPPNFYNTQFESSLEGTAGPICASPIINTMLGLSIYISVHGSYMLTPGNYPSPYNNSGCMAKTELLYSVTLGGLLGNGAVVVNWFPYEYRPVFVLPETATVTFPVGWSFLSPSPGVNNYQNFGIVCVLPSAGIVPLPYFSFPSSTQVTLDARNTFADKSGPINLKDESIYFKYSLYYEKNTCVSGAASTWGADFRFEETNDTSVHLCFHNTTSIPAIPTPSIPTFVANPASQTGLQTTATYTLTLTNTPTYQYLINPFLYIPPSSLSICSVTQTIGNGLPTPLNPVVGFTGMYHLTTIAIGQTRTFQICFNSSCIDDTIDVVFGWSCHTPPTDSVAYLNYTCDKKICYLYYHPDTAHFQIQDMTLTSNVDLCDTIDIIFRILNTSPASANDVMIQALLPAGLEYVVGTSYKKYPANALSWTSIANPIPANPTSTLNWSLNTIFAQNPYQLSGTGPNINEMWLKFSVRPACGYISGSQILECVWGQNPCNTPTDTASTYSPPIQINGLTGHDTLVPNIEVQVLPPANLCIDTLTLHAHILNANNIATGSQNFYQVSLPTTYFTDFVLGSTSSPILVNAMSSTTSTTLTLSWQLPVLQANTAIDFTFKVLVNHTIC